MNYNNNRNCRNAGKFYNNNSNNNSSHHPQSTNSSQVPQNQCIPTCKTQHSQTVGCDGPVLLQDTSLHETLETFVHEKIIERSVHTKGYGAFGCFTTYQSMRAYTKASFLQNPGQTTQTFSRFSFAVSTKGTPDTSRNVRGFSTKFYTNCGIYDLLCNHIPVFLVRDSIKFPDAIHSLSPSPVNNLPSTAPFWKYVAENPETTHFVTWLYSDLGTLDSFCCMKTYGVNTYVWENANCEKHYVKYHWIPKCKGKELSRQEAACIAGQNPNIAGEELYNTLAKGGTYEYELCVQLMKQEDACNLSFDPLDDTKIWDECQYPLKQVGVLTLSRNVNDYQNQVEKSAFSPANLIEGIQLSSDKMLQGRSFIYWDAQRRRIGPDFRMVPVNGEANWSPRTNLPDNGNGDCIAGKIQRSEIEKTDNFSQAGAHYLSLCPEQQAHLVDNIASELYMVPTEIQNCVLTYFSYACEEFAACVRERICWYQNPCQN